MNLRFLAPLAAIPLTFAAGGVLSHLAFDRWPKPLGVTSQPLAVVTSWGFPGAQAWLLYALTIAIAGVAYLAVLAALRHKEERGSIAAILVATILALAAATSFRFVFSSDIYAYAAYGAYAAMGGNPYRSHLMDGALLIDVPFTAAVAYEWPSLPACVYGPVFVQIARVAVIATHADIGATIAILRTLAMLAFLGAVVLVSRLVPRRAAFATAVVGLNPPILWAVAEGHNDALVCFAVGCTLLLYRVKPQLSGVLAGLTAAIKATGGLAALALAYGLGVARYRAGALWGFGAAVVLQLIAMALAGGYQPQAPTDFVGTPWAAIAIGARGLFAVAGAAMLIANVAGNRRTRVLADGALIVWALLPHPYAWYAMWFLPLAALTLDAAEGPALLAATFCGTFRYLSDTYGSPESAPWLSLAAGTIPIAILIVPSLAYAWRTRRTENTVVT